MTQPAMRQTVDNRAKMEEDLIEAIVQRVLARLDSEFRERALRIREAKLADLRAFETANGLPRSIQSQRENMGVKSSDKEVMNKGGNRER